MACRFLIGSLKDQAIETRTPQDTPGQPGNSRSDRTWPAPLCDGSAESEDSAPWIGKREAYFTVGAGSGHTDPHCDSTQLAVGCRPGNGRTMAAGRVRSSEGVVPLETPTRWPRGRGMLPCSSSVQMNGWGRVPPKAAAEATAQRKLKFERGVGWSFCKGGHRIPLLAVGSENRVNCL